MSTEFEVAGKRYRAGRMDAMTQFHVLRRLGPVLPALKGLPAVLPALMNPAGTAVEAAISDNPETALDAVAEALVPIVEAIAAMSDADSEYVLGACLSVAAREQDGGGWAAVWSAQAKRPMFDDIGMPQMLQIAVNVFTASLRPF